MRHTLLAMLVATAACGGAQKPTTAPPLLTDPNAAAEPETKPEEKPAEPAPPPPAPKPADFALDAPKVTVKLVSAGKGKKAPLRFTPKQGDKQQVELAPDFSGSQTE